MTLIAVFSILLVSLVGGGVDVYAQTIVATPVSSLTSTSFGSLVTAEEISIITINSTPYAIVSTTATNNSGIIIIDISDPENLTAVSAVTGPSIARNNEFRSPGGVDSITINSTPYALVTAFFGDRVNVVDLSNPTSPRIVSSIANGGAFALNGANDVATFQIGSTPYAIVAASDSNGVQIINLSNPASPTAVTSVIDGSMDTNNNTFNELEQARNVTTVTIGSSLYAIVTAFGDAGVQIIDISDPASPLAVSSIAEGSTDTNGNTFSELIGASRITIVTIDSSIYALVAARTDSGVQIINITNPAIPLATSSIEDGGSDGAGGTFNQLAGVRDITTVTIGSSTYALATSDLDDGIQIIDISDPTTPLAVFSVSDGTDGFDTLDGANGIATLQIGSVTYALVTASAAADAGIQVISLSEPVPTTTTETTVTMNVSQPNLPTITFLETTIDIGLDDTGRGFLELQSLVDAGTVSVADQGALNLRLEFDRLSVLYAAALPGSNGIFSLTEIPVPASADISGLVVILNATHIEFKHTDPSVRGLLTSIPLQATIHEQATSIYRNNLFVHRVIANTVFNITDPPPICAFTLDAVSLDLGTANVGGETPVDGGTIVVRNSGSMSHNVNIGADHWCDGSVCIVRNVAVIPTPTPIMDNSQTRFATTANVAYDEKKTFTVFEYGTDAGNAIRGTTASPFVLPPLFLLTTSNSTGTAYLQTEVALRDVVGLAQNRFEGDVVQEIIIEGGDCN